MIIKKNEVRCMGFKVEKTVYVNKTFRLDTKLVEQLEQICIDKNISLNKLIVKCINYALENLEEDEETKEEVNA